VLSSCAWATGRALNPGPARAGWLDGFDNAAKEFRLQLSELIAQAPQAAAQCEAGVDEPPTTRIVDHNILDMIRRSVRSFVGLAQHRDAFACSEIRIKSYLAKQSAELDADDFLNSFYANDLAMIAERAHTGDVGEALATYLSEDDEIDEIRLRDKVERYQRRWGRYAVDSSWRRDVRRRELDTLWCEPDTNAARSELFVAALRLHKVFLAHTAKQMRDSLFAAMDLLTGDAPPEVPEHAALAAWQALYFVVPVVSTTFASLPRMLRHLGREALGWMLIDEAGQAAPQEAVGALWRARRAVIVGDPLQLKPVVTLPFRGQQGIRAEYGVSEKWMPKLATVQELADRHNCWGTYLQRRERSMWVGAPLQVHRRCSEPMFTISNTVAYDGMMIHGSDPTPNGALPPSRWINVIGPASGHYKPVELEQAKQLIGSLLAGLTDCPLTPTDIIVISPFRDIARELSKLRQHFGHNMRAGTVHTAQGKQARVVILVLGGDPRRPGAKRWAASEPNLVNVAVSRSKERLYVIGDEAAWSCHDYFDVMAQELAALAEGIPPAEARQPSRGHAQPR
jgi:hypothetical protein